MTNTQQANTNAAGEYTPERARLHQQIIEHFMRGTRAQSQPQAIFTAGGAGSGKQQLDGHAPSSQSVPVPRGHVYVNPNTIATMLPEHQDGDDTQDEACDVAKLLTAIAIKRKRPLVIHGTGAGEHFADRLQAAKLSGYKVTARYAHVPTATAIDNVKSATPYVDPSTVAAHHAAVSSNFLRNVKNLPGISIDVLSTIGTGKPTVIAHKPEKGRLQVVKPTQYKQMTDKAVS